MKLIEEQATFLRHFAELVQFATAQGFLVTAGELYRPVEMQELYMRTGKSMTMNSQHLKRLAGDLNFFLEGRLVEQKSVLQPLGDFWEGLSPKNRWGGNWRGLVDAGKSHFVDCPHFERKV